MLQPFARREQEYRRSITDYIKKTYPLIGQLYGDEGVDKIVDGELGTTRNIYNNLPHTVQAILQKKRDILIQLFIDKNKGIDQLVETVSTIPPNTKYAELENFAKTLTDADIINLKTTGKITDVIEVHALLKARRAIHICPFKKTIKNIIASILS